MHVIIKTLLAFLLVTFSSISLAATGPIILGGDDLDDHGSRNGAGVNLTGWAYAEAAVGSLIAQSSNTGTTVDIVAIGPADPGAATYPNGNSGGMVKSVTDNLGLSVTFIDGVANITSFFTSLSNGTVKPKLIWIVSDGATNDLSPAEDTELALHGAELNAFQQSGGGILSHSHNYGWLTSLLPGISIDNACGNITGLTPDGNTAFPSITDAQVQSPCHNSFSGNLGGLSVLAVDGSNPALNVIIGGSAGVTITPSENIPTLSTWGLILMVSLLGLVGGFKRRRSL